jgi:ankyrin repeat protein
MRSSLSPSSGSLVLDDIRLGVINGNLDYFKSQIECENNFFIDTVLKAGWTSLMYASNNGHKDLVHYCLESGADPNYHKGIHFICFFSSNFYEYILI